MHLFFDIFHNGEFFLDAHGRHFASVDHARNHLIDTMREYIRLGGHPSDIDGDQAAIDITDRGQVRRIVRMRDIVQELVAPMQQAA